MKSSAEINRKRERNRDDSETNDEPKLWQTTKTNVKFRDEETNLKLRRNQRKERRKQRQSDEAGLKQTCANSLGI